MAKTRVPIVSEDEKEMPEAGLAATTYFIGNYEHERPEIREARSKLSGVQAAYFGDAKVFGFPAARVHWSNFYNKRKEEGHAVEYRARNLAIEFKPGEAVDVATLVAEGDLIPVAG